MTLHGQVRVNGRLIGEWSAQRVETAEPCAYECSYFDGATGYVFRVQHEPTDGAPALAAKVLAEAATFDSPTPTTDADPAKKEK